MTILDCCISLNSVLHFLVVLGVVDMCHLLLNTSSSKLLFLNMFYKLFEVLRSSKPCPLCWNRITFHEDFSRGRNLTKSFHRGSANVFSNRGFIDSNSQIPIIVVDLKSNNFIWMLWQYRLWSFQWKDTKLERFLAKNQL